MNGFDSARGIETQAMSILLPYLEEVSEGRLVMTEKGTLARWLQECVGDVVMSVRKEMLAVEIKAERQHTGNLFLETFSNRNLEDRANHARLGMTPGWLMKIRADLLLYYFLDKDILYSVDVFSLKRWMFGHSDRLGAWGRGRFKERMQRRYSQLNDTWGVIVPLRTLHEELPTGALRWTAVRQRELVEAA